MSFGGIALGVGRENENIGRGREKALKEGYDRLNAQLQIEQALQNRRYSGLQSQEIQAKLKEIQQQMQQRGALIPEGEPYRAEDGKLYQRYRNPLTGKVETQLSTEPEEESPMGSVLRQLNEAKGRGIELTPEAVQRIVENTLGGKGTALTPKAARFGSFVRDKSSPTGFSREILDGTTLAPTGKKDYGLPPGTLPKWRTVYKVRTNQDGSQDLVPVTETSGVSLPPRMAGGGSQSPSAGGMPPTRASAGGASVSSGAKAQPQPTTDKSIPWGHKPLDAMSRRTIVAANQAKSGVDRLLRIFMAHPDLREDNNPITPALDWLAYQSGHFNPPEPQATLIKEAALIGITAAGLYSQGRMSKYLFEKAQQHLPQPNDSPELLYEKIKWLKENRILDDMIEDIKNPMRDANAPKTPYGPGVPPPRIKLKPIPEVKP